MNTDGNTPLHLAARNGKTEVVDILLLHHAPVNMLDFRRSTALHEAAKEGTDLETPFAREIPVSRFEEIVEMLLKAGADVNVIDTAGRSPLKVAHEANRSRKIFSMLLRYGAR